MLKFSLHRPGQRDAEAHAGAAWQYRQRKRREKLAKRQRELEANDRRRYMINNSVRGRGAEGDGGKA